MKNMTRLKKTKCLMAIHYNQNQFQYLYPEAYKAFGSRI